MFASGPLIALYFALYLWTAASSMLGVYCALDHPLILIAAGSFGGFAVLFSFAFYFRLVLVDMFQDLSPKERFGVFLMYIAVFFAPYGIMRDPPLMLSFVSLNALLSLNCQVQRNWQRLLLNNCLIVFGALLVYRDRLSDAAVWGVLGFVGVMWVVTAILDHFAATLDRSSQNATGMGKALSGLLSRQVALVVAITTPLVVATLWWTPDVRLLQAEPGEEGADRPVRVARAPTESEFWELTKYAVVLIGIVGLSWVVLKFIQRRVKQVHIQGLGEGLDESATGSTVLAEAPERHKPRPTGDPIRDRMIASFETFCESMRRLERERPFNQTAREYCRSLSDLSTDRRALDETTRLFEEARYSDCALSEKEAERFQERLSTLRLAGAKAYAEEQARILAEERALAEALRRDRDDGAQK